MEHDSHLVYPGLPSICDYIYIYCTNMHIWGAALAILETILLSSKGSGMGNPSTDGHGPSQTVLICEALYFAWLNHFTLWLLAPAVVGLLCFLRMWLGSCWRVGGEAGCFNVMGMPQNSRRLTKSSECLLVWPDLCSTNMTWLEVLDIHPSNSQRRG